MRTGRSESVQGQEAGRMESQAPQTQRREQDEAGERESGGAGSEDGTFSAFFEIDKIHTPSHRFDTQNLQIFAIFRKIRLIFQIFANVAEIAAKIVIFR